jgi:hypothetical protein
MADDADISAANIQRETERLIAAARRPAAHLPYTGLCHWCGAITGGGRRFCDADCRDDWQRSHG